MSGSGRPTTRRPARDLVGPVSARICLRSGQYPAFRPHVPPHPCSYLGRSRLRRIRIRPVSRSTCSHFSPSASPWRSPRASATTQRGAVAAVGHQRQQPPDLDRRCTARLRRR